MTKVSMNLGGRELSIETGRVAKQAGGACLVRYGDTVVLVTAVASPECREGIDFFPLTVDYRERAYAGGRFPGGFIKRESRPSDREILIARLIDRPIRPLFNEELRNEVQIMATVLSVDQINTPDIPTIIGASAALSLSDFPFAGPVGAVRMGKVGDNLIVNPSLDQMEKSRLDLVVAGTNEAILMVEAGAKNLSEEEMLEAIEEGHRLIKEIVSLQRELVVQAGLPKREVISVRIDPALEARVRELSTERIAAANLISEKQARQQGIDEAMAQALEELAPLFPEEEADIKTCLELIEREIVRGRIINEGLRADNRRPNEIRSISCEVDVLPRVHGSALFTRGQTQALAAVTLGTVDDEQILDDIEGRRSKSFMFHYNFPSFSTGETKPNRGPSRRDIGHGMLAERALRPVIPASEKFPYTIRIVSDILESNGSTSMASVCGGTLSLMNAGVPIDAPVAGIAMGLIKEGDKAVILTDITGLEDHLGDMDLKVAGTKDGVTALQMDIKIGGIDHNIMVRALNQAKEARLFILDEMTKVIDKPAAELSPYAPRIITINIPPAKIKDVIGPGGKVIRNIVEVTGVKIDINDDGKVSIASIDQEAAQQAVEMVEYLTAEAEVGKTYLGKVVRVVTFGAFVEILPGKDGLVHISQLAEGHVRRVEDVVKEGDEVLVKVINIDEQGRISLSRKAALREKTGGETKPFQKNR
ncbi:MAG: polyribonucleotide nucleotidyltransferase [bacterium]